MQGRIVKSAVVTAGLFATLLTPLPGVPMTGAEAATPARIWSDVSRIGVQCLAVPGTATGVRELQAAVCERVRQIAARGAPAPVSVVQLGDPAVLASGTVMLLVHVSIQPAGRQRLAVFHIRPFRATTEQTSVLFGAAPRAAPIAAPANGNSAGGNSAGVGPALEAALAETLSEILPWQARPQGPREIPARR